MPVLFAGSIHRLLPVLLLSPDTLLHVIHNHRNVTFVKVYDRTADAVIEYVGDR